MIISNEEAVMYQLLYYWKGFCAYWLPVMAACVLFGLFWPGIAIILAPLETFFLALSVRDSTKSLKEFFKMFSVFFFITVPWALIGALVLNPLVFPEP